MRAIELLEYRRNNTPKQAAIDILRKYKDMDDVYISFTKIDKLGLNPKSEYDTPIGIYSYPLKAAFKNYRIDEDGIMGFPFASMCPYIWVFKGNIQDFCKITPQQYIDIKRDLIEIYGEEKVNDALDTVDDLHKKNYGSQLWGMTRALTNNSVQWTKLLLKLGFNGLSDKKGYGFIHTNEPCQAVFFTIKGIEILDKIKNNRNMMTPNRVQEIKNTIEYLKNSSEEEQYVYIKTSPFHIKYIKNPSERTIEAAIKAEPSTFKYIKNPSEKITELALTKDARNIQHIKNPSETQQIFAMERSPIWMLKHLLSKGIRPSKKVIQTAVDFTKYSDGYAKVVILDILKQNNLVSS